MADSSTCRPLAQHVQRTYGRKRPRADGDDCAVAHPDPRNGSGSDDRTTSHVIPSTTSSDSTIDHNCETSSTASCAAGWDAVAHTASHDDQLPDLIPAGKHLPHTNDEALDDSSMANADSNSADAHQNLSQPASILSPPPVLCTPVSTVASSLSSASSSLAHSGSSGKGGKGGKITSFFSGSGGLLSLPPGRSTGLGHRYAVTPSSLSLSRAAGEGDGKAAQGGRGSSNLVSPAPALLQLHLDLGQRTIGSITCQQCGMLYTPGLQVDEEAHKVYCARQAAGGTRVAAGASKGQAAPALHGYIPFPGWKHARWVNPVGSDTTLRVLHITARDMEGAHPGVRAKVEEVDSLLARVLGPDSAPKEGGDVCRFWAIGPAPGQAGGGGGVQAVVGVVVVQRLGQAQMARRIKAEWLSDSDSAPASTAPRTEHGEEMQLGQASAPASAVSREVTGGGQDKYLRLTIPAGTAWERAVLGVAQIWVHPSQRRMGVARTLLDAARAHAVWAYPVPLAELAFTQPTREGYGLAARYTGTEAFLVY